MLGSTTGLINGDRSLDYSAYARNPEKPSSSGERRLPHSTARGHSERRYWLHLQEKGLSPRATVFGDLTTIQVRECGRNYGLSGIGCAKP